MKLFTELFEDVQYVTESKENGKKEYFIEGIFLQADIQNRNGRDRKSTRLNSSHVSESRMPSSA